MTKKPLPAIAKTTYCLDCGEIIKKRRGNPQRCPVCKTIHMREKQAQYRRKDRERKKSAKLALDTHGQS